MHSGKAQISFAHFDNASIALRCCLAELWVLKWIKVEFKSCKSPYSIQIQTDTHTCIPEDNIEIE